jgi:hypothetical protein
MIRTAGDTRLRARWKVLSAITVGPPSVVPSLVDVKKGNLWYLNRKEKMNFPIRRSRRSCSRCPDECVSDAGDELVGAILQRRMRERIAFTETPRDGDNRSA